MKEFTLYSLKCVLRDNSRGAFCANLRLPFYDGIQYRSEARRIQIAERSTLQGCYGRRYRAHPDPVRERVRERAGMPDSTT